MSTLQRLRSLPTRQRVGLGVLAGLLVSLWFVPRPVAPPTAAESALVGWQPPGSSEIIARELFDRVNEERATRGLSPLEWSDELAAVAGAWSEEMISRGIFEHSPPDYHHGVSFRGGTGENIAMGQVTSQELHVGWMASDGHRENILRPEWEAAGIGIVCRNDGLMWATQVFGRRAPGPRLPAGDHGPEPIVRDDTGIRCRESDET